MAGWRFEPPANLGDFTNPWNWHAQMALEAQGIILDLVATVRGKADRSEVTEADVVEVAPLLAYVDPVASAPPATAQTVAIAPWPAFPRAVKRRVPWKDLPPTDDDPDGTLRAAEHLGDEDHRAGVFVDADANVLDLPVRDRQDEYLEWTVRRDGSGRITKAIFVAEGYDYFTTLFQHDEQRVVEIYREFTETSSLTADDLRARRGIYRRQPNGRSSEVAAPGTFNPRNWPNIRPGIVHLSHRANSLGAEVNLAGVSGIARSLASGGTLPADDAEKLLCCSAGGNPDRNSDPLIGQQAYRQVLAGNRYTLANPVGLYIAGVARDRFTLPNGQPVPPEWWRQVRGAGLFDGNSRVLRTELAVPAGENLTISDLKVDGVPVQHGGQLADLLTVHLFVTVWPRPTANDVGPIVSCAATCCLKTGTEHLVLSDGACTAGFELRFPDLLGGAGGPVALFALAGPSPHRPSESRGRRAQ